MYVSDLGGEGGSGNDREVKRVSKDFLKRVVHVDDGTDWKTKYEERCWSISMVLLCPGLEVPGSPIIRANEPTGVQRVGRDRVIVGLCDLMKVKRSRELHGRRDGSK